MTDRIMEWLDESQQLADEAHPGPWGHWPEAGTIEVTANNHSKVICNAVRPQGGWGTPIYQSGAEPTAEFIAEARTRFPRAVTVLREIMSIHSELPIYEAYDYGSIPENQDELEVLARICSECSSNGTVEDVENWEWDDSDPGNVYYPCTTVQAILKLNGEEQ